MWQQLRLSDRSKYPIVDGNTYRVRMVCGVTDWGKDQYSEFECVWRQGLKLWVVKENFDIYEWFDMDDVWID